MCEVLRPQYQEGVEEKHDVRYCFVLGSGVSATSGVWMGAQLPDRWLRGLPILNFVFLCSLTSR